MIQPASSGCLKVSGKDISMHALASIKIGRDRFASMMDAPVQSPSFTLESEIVADADLSPFTAPDFVIFTFAKDTFFSAKQTSAAILAAR